MGKGMLRKWQRPEAGKGEEGQEGGGDGRRDSNVEGETKKGEWGQGDGVGGNCEGGNGEGRKKGQQGGEKGQEEGGFHRWI